MWHRPPKVAKWTKPKSLFAINLWSHSIHCIFRTLSAVLSWMVPSLKRRGEIKIFGQQIFRWECQCRLPKKPFTLVPTGLGRWSPGLVLAVGCSMRLDKRVMRVSHRLAVLPETASALAVLLHASVPRFSSGSPCSSYCLERPVFSRRSESWDHTACSRFRRAS